jgi:hypothetical protein
MARKLKTYQTSLGFFDLAIAAPSMKAALEAWGADSNLFHQGAAKESDEHSCSSSFPYAATCLLWEYNHEDDHRH